MKVFGRRNLLFGSFAGMGIGALVPQQSAPAGRTASRIFEGIKDAPVSDVHCHAFEPSVPLSERDFLEELSLAAFMLSAYFPTGIYQQWKTGDPDTRRRLNEAHKIESRVDEVTYHFGQTVFMKHLVRELATFLKCRPTLKDIVAARNERGKDFWGYANALLKDAGYRALLIDTGYRFNRINFKDFASRLNTKIFWVFRLETALGPLLNQDITLEELTNRFVGRLRQELDAGHVGFKSYIASTGLDVRPWPREEAERAWGEYKRTPAASRQNP